MRQLRNKRESPTPASGLRLEGYNKNSLVLFIYFHPSPAIAHLYIYLILNIKLITQQSESGDTILKNTGNELKSLITQGEGYNLEFKERFSNRIAIDFCAFASANGGRIILGVKDDGTITGIKITNQLKSQIYDLARNLDPLIDIDLYELIRSKFGEGSEKSSEKIIFLIRWDHSISAREIAKIIGISRRAVEKHIANLKKVGKLKRIGPAKGGYWEMVENDN